MICINVDGTNVFCHASKRTTCSDVIKMAIPRQTSCNYVLYESRDGVEKMVDFRTRIHKLVRSWGTEKGQYSLVARPDRSARLTAKLAAISKAKKKLQRLRSVLVKGDMKSNKLDGYHGDNMSVDVNKVYKKNITIESDFVCSRRLNVPYPPTPRSCGDGVDDCSLSIALPVRGCGDGIDYDSHDVSDFGFISRGDLDTGFISDDISVCTQEDLNQCFIDSSEIRSCDETLCDVSSALCDLELNIVDDHDITSGTMAHIKDLFCRNGVARKGDEELESFMNSFVARGRE